MVTHHVNISKTKAKVNHFKNGTVKNDFSFFTVPNLYATILYSSEFAAATFSALSATSFA